MLRVVLLVSLLAPLVGWAESSIYRTTDEAGNVVFTDAPPADIKGSERLDIGHVNTAPPPVAREPQAAPDSEEAVDGYAVTITSPANEAIIPNGPGDFSVGVRVQPALENNDSLQLFMDGVPYGDPQRSATWNLTNVFRGQHDLTVGVVNTDGELMVNSPPVRVFVYRPSIQHLGR